MNEKIKCACGCESFINKFDKKNRRRFFINGHNSKGKNHPMFGKKGCISPNWKRKTILCKYCLKIKFIPQCRNNKFCSKECLINYRNQKKIKKECLNCNKTFFVAPNKKYQKYCSKECCNHHLKPLLGKKNKWGNHSEETKRKISEKNKGRKWSKLSIEKRTNTRKRLLNEGKMSFKGKKNSMFGRTQSEETREKIRNSDYHKNLSGKNNPMFGKKRKEKKEFFYKNGIRGIKSNSHLSPNNPEKIIINLFKNNNLSFEYVGNGNKIIGKRFNPDFINEEKKLIIELFGDYWHNLPKYKERDKERFKIYTEQGYKTLIIWEHEVIKNKYGNKLTEKELLDKINHFIQNIDNFYNIKINDLEFQG